MNYCFSCRQVTNDEIKIVDCYDDVTIIHMCEECKKTKYTIVEKETKRHKKKVGE